MNAPLEENHRNQEIFGRLSIDRKDECSLYLYAVYFLKASLRIDTAYMHGAVRKNVITLRLHDG